MITKRDFILRGSCFCKNYINDLHLHGKVVNFILADAAR